MRSRGTRLPNVLLASAAFVFEPSCGRVTDSSPTTTTTTDSGAAGWAGAAGSSAAPRSGGSGQTAEAASDPAAVALDTADCAARRTSDCQGVKSSYSSDEMFDDAPELAQCSRFNSWDGCESLQFTFDAQGCAATVAAHGPGALAPLPELRQCLTAALQNARWPCLVLGTLSYRESCFIR